MANGTITGGTAESGAIAVGWVVSSGTPDYTYSFGSGSYAAGKFSVSLAGDPPAEAINSYGIGVGIVLQLAPGTSAPPPGMFDEAIEGSILGFSAQYAIIWKDASRGGTEWSAPFPAGYACGKCVLATAGSLFDSFELSDCGALEIDAGAVSACEWT